MVDLDGFRANVGIILTNTQGQVLWAKRIGHEAWQFPQGGMMQGETPEQAMYRELYEEVGLKPQHVTVLAKTRGWLRYRLPERFIRQLSNPVCIGQKQKWFLLQLTASEQQINLSATHPAEFDRWRWVSYWYPLGQVVSFKKEVYRTAMLQLACKLPLSAELKL